MEMTFFPDNFIYQLIPLLLLSKKVVSWFKKNQWKEIGGVEH